MSNLILVFIKILLQILILKGTKAGFTLEQGIPHFNTKPYFLEPTTANVTALQGQSAYIHCRVAQLGDKKVSWIRARDLHVLTSGLVPFASDERFLPLHQDRSENWTLHIRYTQKRDSGEYQCQINSQPKKSTSFFLNVVEARTTIQGSRHQYVTSGSPVSILCVTSAASHSQKPELVYWYLNSTMVTPSDHLRINTTFSTKKVQSELLIQQVADTDSGNYTCWPARFPPDSLTLHVIADQEPAAMSHGNLNSNGGKVPGSDASIVTSASIVQSQSRAILILFILAYTNALYLH